MWYSTRFYDHQPDLTPSIIRAAQITKIMGYGLELGIFGFRMDAVAVHRCEQRNGHPDAA